MATTKKYRITKNLILQKLDNKLIGFDVEKSYLYTFNETAEFIFKKIKAGWDEKKILSALAKKYRVDASILKKDMQELIKNMVKNKILTIL
jgi:hypothetical protein